MSCALPGTEVELMKSEFSALQGLSFTQCWGLAGGSVRQCTGNSGCVFYDMNEKALILLKSVQVASSKWNRASSSHRWQWNNTYDLLSASLMAIYHERWTNGELCTSDSVRSCRLNTRENTLRTVAQQVICVWSCWSQWDYWQKKALLNMNWLYWTPTAWADVTVLTLLLCPQTSASFHHHRLTAQGSIAASTQHPPTLSSWLHMVDPKLLPHRQQKCF